MVITGEPRSNPARSRRVLVVSDRYPPEVAGGAELSLRDVLRALDPAQWHIRVVAMSDRGGTPRLAVVDGIAVEFVGSEHGWPPRLGRIKARLAAMGRWQKRLLGPFVALALVAAYLFRSFGGIARRTKRLFLLIMLAAFDREHFGKLEEPFDCRSPIARHVQAMIDEWRPDIVHFDNKDSIMLSAELDLGSAKMAAMVRDHRFFCGHPRQRMMVGARACASCAFGCVADVAQPQRDMVVREMASAIALRHHALAKADVILTTSGYLVDQLASAGIATPAIATGNPHPAIADFERAAGTIARVDPPEILFVGHLREAKGPLVLLDCLPQLAASLGDFRLVFAGRGPLRDDIMNRAEAMGLSQHVEMLGFVGRDEIYRCLARARVVVGPTLGPEGFGRLPLEAAISRRPIVASAIGGHCETIVEGMTGLLVPPGDRDALVRALVGLLADRARADAMGEAAYRLVTARYAPDLIAERLTAAWMDPLPSIIPLARPDL